MNLERALMLVVVQESWLDLEGGDLKMWGLRGERGGRRSHSLVVAYFYDYSKTGLCL